jgi:trimethylamine--corrinoid protein Co-methyltransferase
MALAGERVQKMLADYQAPHLDESIREGLEGYVARKKDSMPDAFL